MVKLYFISVIYKHDKNSTILKSCSDLSSFGYFQKKSVGEFMKFTSKMIVDRSERASRSSIKEQEYLCHVYVRADNLAAVIISDQEYPNRVAHTLLSKILDDFSAAIPSQRWTSAMEDSITFNALDIYLVKYQNPQEADAMTKLQRDLDETKIILHETISSLLQRGEKLDDLVAKSDDLSAQSKVFFKTARKTNQCCQYYP
ncbi:synaptobrevin homolog YKT6-like [Panonychus citri]|uniref:synaptobrevin homolog YKT6-like n=1 Tax=Panonychus citri TaxID=50023 RepID=UPI002307017A|nr:synaptobrevin homolog YKT6-like [Panonychus citri]